MFSLKPTKKNILIAATGATIITGSVAGFILAPRATTDTAVQRQEFDSFVTEKENKDMEQDQKIEELAVSSSDSSSSISSSSVVSQVTETVENVANELPISTPKPVASSTPTTTQPVTSSQPAVSSAPVKTVKYAVPWINENIAVRYSPLGRNVITNINKADGYLTCNVERKLIENVDPNDPALESPYFVRVVCDDKDDLVSAIRTHGLPWPVEKIAPLQ